MSIEPSAKEALYARHLAPTRCPVGDVRILPGLRHLAGNDFNARQLLIEGCVPPTELTPTGSTWVVRLREANVLVRLFRVISYEGFPVWFAGLSTSTPPTAADIAEPWVRGARRYVLVSGHASDWKARLVDGGEVRGLGYFNSRHEAVRAGRQTGAPVLDCMRCAHCGDSCYGDFMLVDSTWAAAGMSSQSGRLHAWCVEERLGRDLTIEDFTHAGMNEILHFVYRMGVTAGQGSHE